MSRPICVVDIPGLSRDLLRHLPASTRLARLLDRHPVANLVPSWPALTCPVQATLTTGVGPSQHGILANGIATYRSREDQQLVDSSSFAEYRRDVSFWEQSNQLLDAPRFWQEADSGRDRFTTALLFFQNSMPGFAGAPRPAADIVITPKPEHGPDGKITSLLWAQPRELVPRLFEKLGPFPLMNYWGPMASIASSEWIARAAAVVWTELRPRLQFTYVPHLDYDLQRFGPTSPQAAKAAGAVATALEPLLEAVEDDGEAIVLSEYSMHPVTRCVQPNRLLLEAELLCMRDTPDGRLVDYTRSRAFTLVDHQAAHVYVRDAGDAPAVREALRGQPLRELSTGERLTHRRGGDIQFESEPDAWFDYRWWTRQNEAPVFASRVDIHCKPGYDPLELFFDPAMKGIAQDPTLIRGSHGTMVGCDGILAGSVVAREGLVRAEDLAALVLRALA